MPASTTKVVPPFSPRRLYLFSILLGCGFGLFLHGAENWVIRVLQNDSITRHLSPFAVGALALLLTLGAILLPAVLIGLWLSCLSQKRAQMARAAALAGAAELLASLLADHVLWSLHGGADWDDWPLLGFLLNLAIIAGLSALIALLVRWLIRSLLFTVIEQDGTRCSRCGYQLGSPTITTCPECGVPADTARLRFAGLHRLGAWLQRRSPVLAALLVLFLLIQLPITIRRRTLPALRFLSTFPNRDNMGPMAMIPYPTPPGSFNSGCMGSWTPIPGDPSLAIVVLYIPDRNSPLTPMRLAVASTPVPAVTPPGPQLNFGAPQVACDLGRDLADRIAREGIPPPRLLAALAAEAQSANWSPTTAPAAIFSPSPAPSTHWIDPAPFAAP